MLQAQTIDPPLVIPRQQTVDLTEGRYDPAESIWRARYGYRTAIGARPRVGAPAAELLRDVFGDEEAHVETRVLADRFDQGVRHVRWQQTLHGIPVLDRYASTTVDRTGSASYVLNGFEPGIEESEVAGEAAVRAEEATERAASWWQGEMVRTSKPELAVLPGSPARLVWQLFVWPDSRPSEWRVLVDATTGDLVGVRDETVTKSGRPIVDPVPAVESSLRPPKAGVVPSASGDTPARSSQTATSGSTDGTGFVFDPDPLATAGVPYSPPYVDSGDADSAELRAERKVVVLPDITRGADGMYRLEGPFIRIIGQNSSGRDVYQPPVEALPTAFMYDRAHDGFESVMAYHHLDASQRYVQSLGFDDLQASPLPVNPHGTTSDDSGWIASLRYIFFGTGGVDDAEDVFVLWHEYAHALLEAGAPGLRTTLEGQALHEGWADYWAASYQRALVEQSAMKRTDWRRAFRWDAGDGQVWAGRMLDHSGRYPESTCSDDPNPGACSVHNDGRLWATVLFEIYDQLGRELTDRLNLLSHRYLVPPVTFRDAAAALVQADVDYYFGAHLDVLVEKLGARGLLDVSQFGPLASHQALPATESLGGTRSIEVDVLSVAAPVADVTAFVRWADGTESVVGLALDSGTAYRGDLPLPTVPGRVTYWIRVTDTESRVSVLPSGAPTETFAFLAGPDHTAPVITHIPAIDMGLADWPAVLSATIDDPLGVTGAQVEYRIDFPDGTRSAEGSIPLVRHGQTWTATIDVPASSIRVGSTVSYRLLATDGAQAANQAVDPADGYHVFTVLGVGVLRVFDADHPPFGTVIEGEWRAGQSQVGVTAAPGGGFVWGVGLAEGYRARSAPSRLTLPPMDLTGVDEAWLVFRHWYDTAHDGRAEPGTFVDGALHDGGNVKVSVDGGTSWQLLEPSGGYSGTLRQGSGNPLAGEEVFGGYSYGWRLEAMRIPIGADVRVAFDFGSGTDGSGSSLGRFGWRVDELSVTTMLMEDTSDPVALELPADTSIVSVEAAVRPYVTIRASDDVALADVWVDYRIVAAASELTGRVRMAVSASDPTRFEGRVEPAEPLAAGDRIELRFTLRDQAGNEAVVPPPGEDPLLVEVRRITQLDLLTTARSTGGWTFRLGFWEGSGSGALITIPTPLAADNEAVHLDVRHSYAFGPEAGGRVVLSVDDGRTWRTIAPEGGYPSVVDGPMWSGFVSSSRTERFDLSRWAGSDVMLRFETVGFPSAGTDLWTLYEVRLLERSESISPDVPQTARLHANFPDPVHSTTNVSLTVPESDHLRLEVFDVLGRRVALLEDSVVPAGSRALVWDASGVPSGVYFLRMTYRDSVLTEPAVVAH